MAAAEPVVMELDGIEVRVTNPSKVLFPRDALTKLDLVQYYLAVAPGVLRASGGRPHQLVRYPDGIEGEFFYQKRVPKSHPEWLSTVALRFPSGREAHEVVLRDRATLVWMANLGCIELHPHAVRADDLDHPDELRIDLDPVEGVTWPQIVEVAKLVRTTLEELGLTGWPKTSGSRGMHVNVRIERRWGFDDVRRAALALAREVERRAPGLATSAWWKEERQGVFLDYNQNAKDRTTAAAYSVRPKPDARVSAPLRWDELDACDPAEFTLRTMPARFAALRDVHEGIDEARGSLEALLELSDRQAADGAEDAPWPPHYRKTATEPRRAPPSTRKRAGRTPKHPLLEVARSAKRSEALEALERWKARYPDAAAHLEPADVLVDSMRGKWTTWTRVRVNLRHVPEALRPAPEPLESETDLEQR